MYLSKRNKKFWIFAFAQIRRYYYVTGVCVYCLCYRSKDKTSC